MKSRFVIFLVPLILLTGCTGPKFCIQVVSKQVNGLTLKLNEMSMSSRWECSEPARVSSISVISRTRNETLWSISTPNFSETKNVSTTVYGVVPEGLFGKPAVPLKPDETIEITVHGSATSDSQIFTLAK